MKTVLIEFKNRESDILRGLLSLPDGLVRAGVLMFHGFEGASTTERKSKLFADKLLESGIASLRFDFSGCGISDGDYFHMTIDKQSQEFKAALGVFKKEVGAIPINIFAHSLGICAVASSIDEVGADINKMVFISPVLNQREMLRYYFTLSAMKLINPEINITWKNYRKYLNESDFLKDCARVTNILRPEFSGSDYFMSSKDIDLSAAFDSYKEKVLCILGDKDSAVPMDSVSAEFPNKIIVSGGDHHMEKTEYIRHQWIERAAKFLTE